MTLPKRHGRPAGRPRYTDEPTVQTFGQFLTEAEQAWRDDAARHHVTLTGFTVELSRLYLDPDIRARVLATVREKSRGKLLDGA
jgi:hypothetical protein